MLNIIPSDLSAKNGQRMTEADHIHIKELETIKFQDINRPGDKLIAENILHK